MGAAGSVASPDSNLQGLGKLYVQNRGKTNDQMMLVILETKLSQLPSALFHRSTAEDAVVASSPASKPSTDDKPIVTTTSTSTTWETVSKPVLATLSGIKRWDIQELSGFHAPPPLCQGAVEACLISLGEKLPKAGSERAWLVCKRSLADHRILIQRFQEFSPSSITPQMILKLRRYTSNPSFTAEQVARISLLASQLVEWVLLVANLGDLSSDSTAA